MILPPKSSHRYESTVTSDDLPSLNSSQKAALVTEGFTLTAEPTCNGLTGEATYYTFTNRNNAVTDLPDGSSAAGCRREPAGGNANVKLARNLSVIRYRVNAASSVNAPVGGSSLRHGMDRGRACCDRPHRQYRADLYRYQRRICTAPDGYAILLPSPRRSSMETFGPAMMGEPWPIDSGLPAPISLAWQCSPGSSCCWFSILFDL